LELKSKNVEEAKMAKTGDFKESLKEKLWE
jgi:hypothetical protein